ncbi:hypothetical protein CHS0354_005532 [Potamilus streckersoni]|uniref:Uncharacterized protein n=1 Tax=Potamilus streckersoni TaxID=2493646 RepID=A0AAE0SAK3_9BIVA|nr:hypothetical protein CHS0354_005532 [Potamilus streckersoni]
MAKERKDEGFVEILICGFTLRIGMACSNIEVDLMRLDYKDMSIKDTSICVCPSVSFLEINRSKDEQSVITESRTIVRSEQVSQ